MIYETSDSPREILQGVDEAEAEIVFG